MKRAKIFILIILFSISLTQAAQVRNFIAKDLNFQNVSFYDLKGEKFTIIDFWATWCKPCIKAIPKLNNIHMDYADKGINVVGINVDSPRNSSKVKPFANTYKIKYPVLRDPNSKIASELNVSSYPTLYIIDANNKIVYTHLGFRPGDEKIIIAEIEKLLDE